MNEISDAKEFSDVQELSGENVPGTISAKKADIAEQKAPLPLQKAVAYKKTKALAWGSMHQGQVPIRRI